MAALRADHPAADLEQVWAEPLRSAHSTRQQTRSILEETIRDALAAGVRPLHIARQLGMADRTRIYEIKNSPTAGGDSEVIEPPLPHVVFLRGARVGSKTWEQIKRAMWRRGWHTTLSRGDAWHLARGRVPLILVDFSARSSDDVKVGLVRAVYGDNGKADLPLISGGSIPAPRDPDGELDPEAIARAVQEVIGQSMLQ